MFGEKMNKKNWNQLDPFDLGCRLVKWVGQEEPVQSGLSSTATIGGHRSAEENKRQKVRAGLKVICEDLRTISLGVEIALGKSRDFLVSNLKSNLYPFLG